MPQINLEIGFEEFVPPTDRALIEEGIRAALRAAGVGDVTGGGSFPEPNEWQLRSVINVTVDDLEAGVRILRHKLRELNTPDSTWIFQFEPELITYDVWGIDENNPPTWGW